MKKLTQEELNEVLKLHKLWLEGNKKGVRADLQFADLQFADLQFADLQFAYLQKANLRSAYLQSADLRNANLLSANLQGADLRYANLQGANLRGANLQGANLQNANLRYANLQGANLRNTILQDKIIMSFQYNKHTLSYLSDGMIQIGCEKHTINEWLSSFEAIGKRHNYTDKEIAVYGKMIKGVAKMQKDMESV